MLTDAPELGDDATRFDRKGAAERRRLDAERAVLLQSYAASAAQADDSAEAFLDLTLSPPPPVSPAAVAAAAAASASSAVAAASRSHKRKGSGESAGSSASVVSGASVSPVAAAAASGSRAKSRRSSASAAAADAAASSRVSSPLPGLPDPASSRGGDPFLSQFFHTLAPSASAPASASAVPAPRVCHLRYTTEDAPREWFCDLCDKEGQRVDAKHRVPDPRYTCMCDHWDLCVGCAEWRAKVGEFRLDLPTDAAPPIMVDANDRPLLPLEDFHKYVVTTKRFQSSDANWRQVVQSIPRFLVVVSALAGFLSLDFSYSFFLLGSYSFFLLETYRFFLRL